MTDRMIECPACKGLSGGEWTKYVSCIRCNSFGRIPDRRRPTANDRAVERIKEYVRHQLYEVLDGNSYDDISAFPIAETVLDIINEEAAK